MCCGFHVLTAAHCEAGEFFNMTGILFARSCSVKDQKTDPNLFINEIQFQKIKITSINRLIILKYIAVVLRGLFLYFNGE